MLPLLRYYYLKYLFPYDPLDSWFRHSLKACLACLIAGSISLYLMDPMTAWVFVPVLIFMFIIDVDQPLKKRIILLICAALASVLGALIMALCSFSLWLQYGVFLMIVFAGAYASHYGVDQTTIGLTGILFSMLGFSNHLQLTQIPQLLVFSFLGFAVCFIVLVFIWPEPLNKQIRRNLDVGIFILTRYICIVLSDVVRGSENGVECNAREKQLLNLQIQLNRLVKLEQSHNTFLPSLKQFNVLIQKTILVENSLQGLTERVLLVGPLPRLQIILDLLKPLLVHLRKQPTKPINIAELENQIKLFSEEASCAQDQAHKYLPLMPRDYLQWSVISYVLYQFLQQLEVFSKCYQELN
ncbi:MAG: hypothetical protein EXR81_06555 [Gammaproteobacteria bacterium]|nr:hypothetical protein [Gammaproteobacteria bacterium]